MATKEHKSTVHPDIPNKPGVTNWVQEAGGLPKYIERVAKHIHHDSGYSVSRAIAAAVSQTKKRAAGGNKQAAAAIVKWNKMKASSNSKSTNLSVSQEYREKAPTVTVKDGNKGGNYPIKDKTKLKSAVRLFKMHRSKYSPAKQAEIRKHILSAAKKLGTEVSLSNEGDNPLEMAIPGGTRDFNEQKHRRGPGGKFAQKAGGGTTGSSKTKADTGSKRGTGQTAKQQIERLGEGGVFDIPGVDGQIKKTEDGFVVTGPGGFETTASSATEAMSVAARVLKKSSKPDKEKTGISP